MKLEKINNDVYLGNYKIIQNFGNLNKLRITPPLIGSSYLSFDPTPRNTNLGRMDSSCCRSFLRSV